MNRKNFFRTLVGGTIGLVALPKAIDFIEQKKVEPIIDDEVGKTYRANDVSLEYSGWRIPTVQELDALYRMQKEIDNQIFFYKL